MHQGTTWYKQFFHTFSSFPASQNLWGDLRICAVPRLVRVRMSWARKYDGRTAQKFKVCLDLSELAQLLMKIWLKSRTERNLNNLLCISYPRSAPNMGKETVLDDL